MAEIDNNVLLTLAETLANAAQLLNVAIAGKKEGPKIKRGRPKKTKPLEPELIHKGEFPSVNPTTEIIEEQDVKSIIEEDNQKERTAAQKKDYIFKVQGRRTQECREETVTNRRGQQKFLDVSAVAHEDPKGLNWEPTDRRNPAQMIDFTCSKCNRPFKDYASNHPEAFFGAGGVGRDYSDSYSIMCNRCGVK